MKKLTILFSILIASISAFAAATTVSQITLSSASQGDKVLQIVVDNPFSDAYDNGYDAVIGANQPGGLYIYSGSERYSFWATNALGNNLPMGFGAVGDLEYTLSFQYFSGESYTIYDKEKDETITINASTPNYVFTIDGALINTAINDRFIINYVPAPTPTSYTVTPNSFGYASFSAAEATVIPTTGVTVYKGAINGEVLDLSPITDYIPANTGVIVMGTAGQPYEFEVTSAAVAALSDNALKAYTDWASHSGTIYVLKDEALYRYTGSDFPANKAYLQISSANNAPKRISMRFNSTTAIDNVEAGAQAEKFVEDGQVYIRRGNEVYNLQGQIVK